MTQYKETFNSKIDWSNVFVRTGQFPLDRSSIFSSYEDALKYAKGDGSDERGLGKTSYLGQVIAVYEDDLVSIYKIVGNDIMDGENKTIQIRERWLEELISRTDVNILIAESIISDSFKEKVQEIIAGEDIRAKKVFIENKINIVGTPLAKIINPNNSLDVTIEKDNLHDILKMLFEQELYPTNVKLEEGTVTHDTKKPIIKSNYEEGVTVEVGTEVIIEKVFAPDTNYVTTNRVLTNIEYGYSLYNNNTKEYDETEIVKYPTNFSVSGDLYELTYSRIANSSEEAFSYNSSTKETCFLEETTFKADEGENTVTIFYTSPKLTVTFDAIPKIYLCSNLQKTNENEINESINEIVVTANTLSTSSNTFKINGAWFLYTSGIEGTFIYDSDSVRGLIKTNAYKNGSHSFIYENSCDRVVIAFPTKWGVLKQVKDNRSNTIITGNFGTPTIVNVTGANGYDSCEYKVYVYSPDNRLNNGYEYTITIN